MNILYVLIPLTLILVAGGCWAFFWAVDAGQFDDLDSPAWDALEDGLDDGKSNRTPSNALPRASGRELGRGHVADEERTSESRSA